MHDVYNYAILTIKYVTLILTKKLIKVPWHMSIPKTANKLWNITVQEPLKSMLEVLHCISSVTPLSQWSKMTWVRLNMCGKLHLHLKHSIYFASLVKWWFDIFILRRRIIKFYRYTTGTRVQRKLILQLARRVTNID